MKSPDKLIDSRPDEYCMWQTVSELVETAKAIDSLSDERVQQQELHQLNLASQYAYGNHLSVDSALHINAEPAGLKLVRSATTTTGRLSGFHLLDKEYMQGDEHINNQVLPEGLFVTLGVERGITLIGNETPPSHFDLNSYFPVSEITTAVSALELERLLVREEIDDSEIIFKSLMNIIEKTRKYIGAKPFFNDDRKLSSVEPWDFKGPRVPIHTIRKLWIDVFASRAKVFFTDGDNYEPYYVDAKNLKFSGYYWAISSHSFTKNRKPNFVFELYQTSNDDINELAVSDPRGQRPLVYVPVSDAVELNVQL